MSVSESDIAARLQLGALGLWITSRSNRDLNHHHYCDLTMKRTIKNIKLMRVYFQPLRF